MCHCICFLWICTTSLSSGNCCLVLAILTGYSASRYIGIARAPTCCKFFCNRLVNLVIVPIVQCLELQVTGQDNMKFYYLQLPFDIIFELSLKLEDLEYVKKKHISMFCSALLLYTLSLCTIWMCSREFTLTELDDEKQDFGKKCSPGKHCRTSTVLFN